MTRPGSGASRRICSVLIVAAAFGVTQQRTRACPEPSRATGNTGGTTSTYPKRDDDRHETLTAATRARLRASYLSTPMRFEHAPATARPFDFVARGAGYSVAVSAQMTRVLLSVASEAAGTGMARPDVRSATVEMRLAGSMQARRSVALDELPGVTNHLIGSDPRGWRTGIKGFERVRYEQVYRGIDVTYYGNQRQLEYDFIVGAGANPKAIALTFDGANGLRIDGRGNLVISTSLGDLVQHAPVIYQEGDGGTRQPIDGGYALQRGNRVGFRIGTYDRRRPLVIDPVLTYSTYLGGSGSEHALGVAVDGESNILLAGFTTSSNFPLAQGSLGGSVDAFVAKLNAQGNALVYATYLGGQRTDYVSDLEVDAEGNAYVVGTTESWDFPTRRAVQAAINGWEDGFVSKLDAAGSLVYSTYLGGRHEEVGYGLGVDRTGRAYVTGWTASPDFPLVNPLQSSTGGSPAFITTDGGSTWNATESGLTTSIVLSFAIDPLDPATVYAGTQADGVFKTSDGGQTWTAINEGMFPVPVNALAVDASASIVYAATDFGVLFSTDAGAHWTTPNMFFGIVTSLAIDPSTPGTVYAGVAQAFGLGVMKSTDGGLNWTNTGLVIDVFSLAIAPSAPHTLYAGTSHGVFRLSDGGEWTQVSSGFPHRIRIDGLAIDPSNNATLYAATELGLFKTTTGGDLWSPVPSLSGIQLLDVIIAPSAPATLYVTPWAGVGRSDDGGETWHHAGLIDTFVTALAVHPGNPATAYAGSFVAFDAFVARFSPDGSALEFSTYLGGSSFESGSDVTVDESGDAYVVGGTNSDDFPVANALRTEFGGVQDLFVARISASGSLDYATYLGGSAWEDGGTIRVDAAGNVLVAGYTLSPDFPVANAHQPVYGGGQADMFVTKLDPTGRAFIYSTYLGGSGQENSFISLVVRASPALAVSPSGEAFIVGTTSSTDFPAVNAFQTANAGGSSDAFVAKFGTEGALEYSTYLGGAGTDSGRRVAVDADGSAVVVGFTNSANFPTRDPLQGAPGGADDVFVARVSASAPDPNRPRTSFQLSGTEGSAGWHRSAVTVTLSATAGGTGSGIAFIDYSVNGAAFQRYTGPFTVSAEGTARIAARATSVSGAVESPAASTVLRIDTVLPVVTVTSPQARHYRHDEVLSASFAASDAGSGLSEGSPSATLDGLSISNDHNVALLSMPLGLHTFIASATDAAGNAAQRTVTFRIIATVDSLIATVNALAAQGAIDVQTVNGLLAKLTDAKDALDRGRPTVVRNKLREFIDQVDAKAGHGIAPEAAVLLKADAEYVLAGL